jgi:(2Fe-2S) ferredoxin
MMMASRLVAFFVAIASASTTTVAALVAQNNVLIKVCHHKDCVKRGGGEPLLNTFRDLMGKSSSCVTLESSGCLSQCGKGPNVFVIDSDGKEKLYFSVDDPTTASAVLDVATNQEYPINFLVAATSIVEAERSNSVTKKETILTSIITLAEGDPILANSFVHARALYLRADSRLCYNVDGAIQDAKSAAEIAPTVGKVWRVMANAHEANGDIEDAIDALREWANVDATFTTKSKTEIERLSCLLN